MIKSVVTPLLRYILIFKTRGIREESQFVKANNFYCLILRNYFHGLYLNSFVEFIIAQILHSRSLLYFTNK